MHLFRYTEFLKTTLATFATCMQMKRIPNLLVPDHLRIPLVREALCHCDQLSHHPLITGEGGGLQGTLQLCSAVTRPGAHRIREL